MPWTSLLIKRGLSYPGNAFSAGFDPSHPVARKTIVSAATLGTNNVINLLTGKAGTPNINLPAGGMKIKPFLGPTLGFDNSSGSQALSFTSGLAAPSSPFPTTMAAIFSVTALHNNVQCLIENASSAQSQLGIISNTFQLNRWAASNDNTGFTPATGVPYFLACSTDNVGVTNIVWTRLDTGAIRSFTATPASGTTTGTIAVNIGNSGGAGNAFDGFISAVMYSQSVVDKNTLLAWAADPWSFWYPSPRGMTLDRLRGAAAATYFPFNGAFVLP